MSGMRQDLEKLKDEMLEHLAAGNFLVFHCQSHTGEAGARIHWDTRRRGDFRDFLAVARKAEVRLIHFAQRELLPLHFEDVEQRLASAGLEPEELRDFERRLGQLRDYQGFTGALEMSFDLENRLYLFVVRTSWYEEFLAIASTVEDALENLDEEEEDGPMGGYYSRN
jgi:hypothetical protein